VQVPKLCAVLLFSQCRCSSCMSSCSVSSWRPAVWQVEARHLVAGALDISGASPRRFFLEVLQHFAEVPAEADRLQYLASPEGRDDMYRYNQREGAFVAGF
jgi:hypothetical protein